MRLFSELFDAVDRTNKTSEKIEFIKDYFSIAPDSDKIWVLYLFSGGKVTKKFKTSQLKELAIEYSNIPKWLFDESYNSVGDLSETISLILPESEKHSEKSLSEWIKFIEELNKVSEEKRKEKIIEAWSCLNQKEIFLFNKLITGGFRVEVSQKAMIKAISELEGIDTNVIAHRLMGKWNPDRISFKELLSDKNESDQTSRPYPFFLIYPIEDKPEVLGNPGDWQAEWKWDGIRVQMIFREGELFIWTKNEELVTNKFPEFEFAKSFVPDGLVLDGEIIGYSNGTPMTFSILEKRIARKNVTQKILKDVPVVFMIYDVLEFNGIDMRSKPLRERRDLILDFRSLILDLGCFKISEEIKFSDWNELRIVSERSREYFTEGIILKRKDSEYRVGRKKGDWWEWDADPLSIDAVLMYAQKGTESNADIFTNYTFGVWNEGELVSFTKVNSGLTDSEIQEVDEFIKRNTLEKFGPVRTVKPELVFEIAFEGIAESNRHKSGVVLHLPRIARWSKDKKIDEADSLVSLKKLLKR